MNVGRLEEKGNRVAWGSIFPGMLISVAGDHRMDIPPMRVGEKRTTYVPSQYGFGLNAKSQVFDVREYSDMIIDVELQKIQRVDCFAPGISLEVTPVRFKLCQKELGEVLQGPMDTFNNEIENDKMEKIMGGAMG